MIAHRLKKTSLIKATAAVVTALGGLVFVPSNADAASQAPLVTSFSSSMSTISQIGATVTLSGSSIRATKCTLTVQPAIPSFPTTCPTTAFTISTKFPPNQSNKTVKYLVTMKVKKIASSSRRLTIVERPAKDPLRLTWSPAQSVFNPVGSLTAVSCPSSQSCTAVDSNGSVFQMDQGAWKIAKQFSEQMTSVSCWSAKQCVAVGFDGFLASSSKGSWTRIRTNTTAEFTAVSCASPTLCVAVDGAGDGTVFNPSTNALQVASQIDTTGTLVGIACANATSSCLAVDDAGGVLTFNNGFGPVTTVASATAFTSVACPSAATCLASTTDGSVMTFDHANPTSSQEVSGGVSLTGISCSSTTMCTATTDTGQAVVTNGLTSVVTTSLSPDGLVAVSCSGTSDCVALTPWSAVRLLGTTVGTSTTLEATHGVATDLSCASHVLCAAVSSNGYVSTFNGTTWSQPLQAAAAALSSVSCPTNTFCLAVGDNGAFSVLRGATWSAGVSLSGQPSLTAVSCTTAVFCLAVDNDGQYYLWSGVTWSAARDGGQAPKDLAFNSVSCASSTMCVMTDNTGHVIVWQGNKVAGFFVTRPNSAINGASCPSEKFCVFGDSLGNGVLFNQGFPATWKSATIDPVAISEVSCTQTIYCVAIDDSGVTLSVLNGVWSAPGATGTTPLTSGTAISCVDGPWCMALDQTSQVSVGTYQP